MATQRQPLPQHERPTQTTEVSKVEHTEIIGQNTVASDDIVLDESVQYRVGNYPELRLWLAAKVVGLAGADTITFKFFKELEINGVKEGYEIATTAAIEVSTPAVSAGESAFVAVPDNEDIIKSADYYTVSGTITVATTGYALTLLGKSQAS